MDAIIAPLFQGPDVVTAAKAIGVRAKQIDGYWMLDYDMIKADWSNPMTWWCRGLVTTHDGHVVCCPMRKFFNLGETPSGQVPPEPFQWDRVKAYEKLDGTMVNRWWHNGSWHVSTRYNMGSGLPKHSMAGVPLNELIDTALATLNLSTADGAPGCDEGVTSIQPVTETWTFEVCSPHNRIVVTYDHIQAHLLSRRITSEGTELPIESFAFACPQYTGVTDPDGAKNMANAKAGTESEGLVCFDGRVRLKVKNVHYMNHFRTRSQPPWVAALETWREGDESEVLLYAPHLAPLFERLKQLVAQAQAAADDMLSRCQNYGPKAFAAEAKKHHSLVSQWLFLRYRHQENDNDIAGWMRHHPKLQQWAKDMQLPAVVL